MRTRRAPARRDASGTYPAHSRTARGPSVEGWRFSTSCCLAGAPSAAASGHRSAASACSGSCVVCLRAATVAELPRPGRFGVAPNAAVDGSRSPRPAQPSCTRSVRVLSSHPGKSEDAGISRLSPPRSSPPASRDRTPMSSHSSPAIVTASCGAVTHRQPRSRLSLRRLDHPTRHAPAPPPGDRSPARPATRRAPPQCRGRVLAARPSHPACASSTTFTQPVRLLRPAPRNSVARALAGSTSSALARAVR